jgi:hypothetical protein
MKTLADIRNINENSFADLPVVLVLRRKAVRLFPSGERVAVYVNDNFHLNVAIPYNPKVLGKESINAAASVKEEVIDELSDKTLKNYASKADDDYYNHSMEYGKDFKAAKKDPWPAGKYRKRLQGITKAYQKRSTVKEELSEAVIHKLHQVTKTGEPVDVMFKNGSTARITPQQAKAIMLLHTKLNPQNKAKVEALVNSSPDGLKKVADFCDDHLK